MRIRLAIGLGHLAAAVAAVAALAVVPGTAAAQQGFAPASQATVHPGVMTFTEGAQCTANFVFTDGSDVYLGQAAHCAGTGSANETNGCTAGSRPLGTAVEVRGASQPGTLVYSSWRAMQDSGETNPNLCAFNDFALVRLDPADVGRTNPTMPFWGGPTGLDTNGTVSGERVFSYQNSSLRAGLAPLSPKTGTSLGTSGAGATHTVFTVTPGVPGDSGSGFLSRSGQAVGTLSTIGIAPLPASNGVSDLATELGYANANGFAVSLVSGTEAFSPIL